MFSLNHLTFLKIATAFAALLAAASLAAQPPAPHSPDELVASMGGGFTSGNANVNGITLHYVRGGTGPAVILLHGFPQDWYEFHKVMPLLAKNFTVVAVDLRGVGGSTPTPTGYDAANLAEDIHQLALQLHLDHVYLVGHDIGGMVAYAFVRRYPQTARGVMILDVPLPGLDPWEQIQTDPLVWHIRFHQAPGLAEQLVAGRQTIYFRYFLRPPSFTDADVAHYAESYAAPDHLRVAFEFYRAFPADAQFNAAEHSPIDLPIVFGSGEHDAFAKYVPAIAAAMRAHGCANVKTELIPNSVHYIADEQPAFVAEIISRYAAL
jgi:pimeloyl-ACP methyl ester carboxylesterase